MLEKPRERKTPRKIVFWDFNSEKSKSKEDQNGAKSNLPEEFPLSDRSAILSVEGKRNTHSECDSFYKRFFLNKYDCN